MSNFMNVDKLDDPEKIKSFVEVLLTCFEFIK